MTEKTQKEDVARVGTEPETATAEEPAEIKGRIGATGGGEGAVAAVDGPKSDGSVIPPEELERLRTDLIAALKTVFDPEIPVDIYELGLIYNVEVSEDGDATITMTLTTPHCPVAESMPGEVEMRVLSVPGIRDAVVNLVWDPPWDPSKMSDEARLELGML
jgi:FeS assembly SUF system protein